MFLLTVVIAFLAAILTFFSGFWIGTILLPVFTLFFPLDLAVAMTWIVHLANNIFKVFLVGRKFDKTTVIKLGITGILGSFVGAYTFLKILNIDYPLYFSFFWYNFSTNIVKFVIGILLIFFSIFETFSDRFKMLRLTDKKVYILWFLSWFFWGLSWHQGALRTLVLTKLNLEKEVFIATWVMIAILVDVTRLWIYFWNIKLLTLPEYSIIILTICWAFLGSYIGRKLLKKVTIIFVKIIVLLMLLGVWLCMMLGFI